MCNKFFNSYFMKIEELFNELSTGNILSSHVFHDRHKDQQLSNLILLLISPLKKVNWSWILSSRLPILYYSLASCIEFENLWVHTYNKTYGFCFITSCRRSFSLVRALIYALSKIRNKFESCFSDVSPEEFWVMPRNVLKVIVVLSGGGVTCGGGFFPFLVLANSNSNALTCTLEDNKFIRTYFYEHYLTICFYLIVARSNLKEIWAWQWGISYV